jgi:quercetin dioxygenase-like cupin family protein
LDRAENALRRTKNIFERGLKGWCRPGESVEARGGAPQQLRMATVFGSNRAAPKNGRRRLHRAALPGGSKYFHSMKNKSSVWCVIALTIGVLVAGLGYAEEAYTQTTQTKVILKTSVDTAGQPMVYPTNGTPEITGLLVEIPVGAQTGWHLHPSPCVAYVLQGEVTVEIENGVKPRFQAGDSFAEVRNLKHCGYNTGLVPLKILLFAIGTQGTPVSKAVSAK